LERGNVARGRLRGVAAAPLPGGLRLRAPELCPVLLGAAVAVLEYGVKEVQLVPVRGSVSVGHV
jgi:hypothetical protein